MTGDASTLEDTRVGGKDAVATDDSTATTDSSTTPDAAASVPYCQMTCSSASDCAQTGAAFDADNYACEGGLCRYQGCNSDAECVSTFSSDKYACRDIAGTKTCQTKCTTVSDCAIPGSAAYSEDNWACDAGTCKYVGCKSDSECSSSIGAGYVCRKAPWFDPTNPLVVPTCQKSCAIASNCATTSAAYDTDNYACESGLCRYIGCNSDEECRSSLMKSNYACR